MAHKPSEKEGKTLTGKPDMRLRANREAAGLPPARGNPTLHPVTGEPLKQTQKYAQTIDYFPEEEGIPAKLRCYRHVLQYRTLTPGEDGGIDLAREVRRDDPKGFMEDWERMEKEWAAKKGEKVNETPLSIDPQTKKCLDAIEAFLTRHAEEAKIPGNQRAAEGRAAAS